MKPAALLLLLAVAAGQLDVSLSDQTVSHNISTCSISFYGQETTWVNATITGNSSSICFGNAPGSTPDCLLLNNTGGSQSLSVSITQYEFIPKGFNNKKAPCIVSVQFKGATLSTVDFSVFDLGSQAGLQTKSSASFSATHVNLIAQVGGSTVDSWSYTKEEADKFPVKDISGCRDSGKVFLPNKVVEPFGCVAFTCDHEVVLKNLSVCGPTEFCSSNKCTPLTFVCTVTGSSVISFHGRVNSVQDRCAYKLVNHPSFQLVADFQDKRRRDVVFLNSLTVSSKGQEVILEQGGKALVNKNPQSVNAVAQVIGMLELSKDNNGFTVKITNSSMTLRFDGNVVHVSGFAENMTGLCGNPGKSDLNTTPAQELNQALSDNGCEKKYNDSADSSINCTRSTEHCNLLKQAPFTACDIDPQPYITACTNILCNYPMVDTLNCQFFEAYAAACSLKNIALDGWRTTTGCPALPQPFCLDQDCSDHEFCGEKHSGGASCLCRSSFSSKYKATKALGEPTVCSDNSATLTLAGCLLVENGIDYSVLHLNNPNCTGQMDNKTHMVTFSFDSNDMCGTEVLKNNSQLIYKNSVSLRNESNSVITRRDQVQIDFSCLYSIPDVENLSFKIKDSSVMQNITSGVWNYTLAMTAYSDVGRTVLITPSTDIQLNQKIWIELKAEGLDADMVAIVITSCWVTSEPLANATLKYDLIMNKCPSSADQTVSIVGNGLGTSNYFSFNTFQFANKNGPIYLHCQVELCPTKDQSCAPSCGSSIKRRRSIGAKYVDGNPGLLTMAWSP